MSDDVEVNFLDAGKLSKAIGESQHQLVNAPFQQLKEKYR